MQICSKLFVWKLSKPKISRIPTTLLSPRLDDCRLRVVPPLECEIPVHSFSDSLSFITLLMWDPIHLKRPS